MFHSGSKYKEQKFEDLSLVDMIMKHDGWYMMSDCIETYQEGNYERLAIEKKVAEHGGWSKELIKLWNESGNPTKEL